MSKLTDKSERVVNAVLADSAFGGLEVSIDDGTDSVFWRTNHGTPERWHKAKIRYTPRGDAYFLQCGRRVKLRDMLSV